MKSNHIKVKSDYLTNLISKNKTSEVRFNDRDYQVGDTNYLYNYENLGSTKKISSYDKYSGYYKISHIHSGLGMADNYVVLSFKKFVVVYL